MKEAMTPPSGASRVLDIVQPLVLPATSWLPSTPLSTAVSFSGRLSTPHPRAKTDDRPNSPVPTANFGAARQNLSITISPDSVVKTQVADGDVGQAGGARWDGELP